MLLLVFSLLAGCMRKGTCTARFVKLELGMNNTFYFVNAKGQKPSNRDTLVLLDWELESCAKQLSPLYNNPQNAIGKTFEITWIEPIDEGETMEFEKGHKHWVIESIRGVK